MDEDLARDMAMECPICFQIYKDQRIFQCDNGHASCEGCFDQSIWNKKPRICSVCSIKVTRRVRVLALEQVAKLYSKDDKNPKKRKRSEGPDPEPIDETEHKRVHCDGPICKKEPQRSIRGLRYKCLQCNDYDLCSGCFNANIHDKKHLFVCLREDTKEDVLELRIRKALNKNGSTSKRR